MTFNIILFLKAHKLYKIPPPQKKQCVHYWPSLENMVFKHQMIPMMKAHRPKTRESHARITTILLSKIKISWQVISPESPALSRKVCFVPSVSQEKNFNQYNLGRRIPCENLAKWQWESHQEIPFCVPKTYCTYQKLLGWCRRTLLKKPKPLGFFPRTAFG